MVHVRGLEAGLQIEFNRLHPTASRLYLRRETAIIQRPKRAAERRVARDGNPRLGKAGQPPAANRVRQRPVQPKASGRVHALRLGRCGFEQSKQRGDARRNRRLRLQEARDVDLGNPNRPRCRTRSIAPTTPRPPLVSPAPSNAGPAAVAQPINRSPTLATISPLVPTSMSRVGPLSKSMPVATIPAVKPTG